MHLLKLQIFFHAYICKLNKVIPSSDQCSKPYNRLVTADNCISYGEVMCAAAVEFVRPQHPLVGTREIVLNFENAFFLLNSRRKYLIPSYLAKKIQLIVDTTSRANRNRFSKINVANYFYILYIWSS